MHPIYDGSRRRLAADVPTFGVDDLPEPPPAGVPITLTFLTPTRLVHNGTNATPAEFHVFFRNVLRRVNLLNHFHCAGELWDDALDLIAEAGRITAATARLRWLEWDRYSARQGQRVPMGGFIGRVSYAGNLCRLWPWLALGQWVHVGKGATLGLGEHRVEVGEG